MALILPETNRKIRKWGNSTAAKLRSQVVSLGIKHTSKSPSPRAAINSISARYRERDGLINRVGYVIPRHMIYVHKGVGRGTSIEQVGNTKRQAKPWFNPVIEKNIDELADIIANDLGNSIINNLFIK